MKKIVIFLIFIVVILSGGILYLLTSKGMIGGNGTDSAPLVETGMPTEIPIDENTKDKSIKVDGVSLGNIKSGIIEASNFKFTPEEIVVNQGDTVTITFTNTQGLHDFTIDDFKVKSKTLESGQSEEVTFVADKKGTFEFYCSIGQHKAMGMVGKLLVQ